jgi:hypothetical protein
MATTPEDQEIRLSKVDLWDRLWRLVVKPEQKWNFCYVMPDPTGSRVRIVVPSALQMGWAESPAYFFAATETGRDIVDLLLREKVQLPAHPLEKFLEPDDTPKTAPKGQEHTAVSVYVDDFILAVVENEDRSLIRRVSRAALHAIHSIFPPPERSGHVGGKDPVSKKKLEKGDARFEIEKEILGFLINGADHTVRLSSVKAQPNHCRRDQQGAEKVPSCTAEAVQIVAGQAPACLAYPPCCQRPLQPLEQGHQRRAQGSRPRQTQ